MNAGSPDRLPSVLFWTSGLVCLLCLLGLGALAAFDAQAERLTSGLVPREFAQRLDSRLTGRYGNVIDVAHNAGDDLPEATRAVAYGADAIEIDVRASGDELLASHNAPLPFLEDLVFRGPTLQQAWDVARLRDAVLLHLKQSSPAFLRRICGFLSSHPLRRVIVQTKDPGTLAMLHRALPRVQRLLLVFNRRELQRVRHDHALLGILDGVSVRESLLSAPVQAWLERHGLLTFAWTVNDERRMNQLIARGVDGLITERLDIMRLLGKGAKGAS